MERFVHVFAGAFETREAALDYTEERWEDEPDETATDEEYAAWEERNPRWGLQEEFDAGYLDGDFVETIDGDERATYVEQLLRSDADREAFRAATSDDDTTVVLVFDSALEQDGALRSTPRLRYLGTYPCED